MHNLPLMKFLIMSLKVSIFFMKNGSLSLYHVIFLMWRYFQIKISIYIFECAVSKNTLLGDFKIYDIVPFSHDTILTTFGIHPIKPPIKDSILSKSLFNCPHIKGLLPPIIISLLSLAAPKISFLMWKFCVLLVKFKDNPWYPSLHR